MKLSELNLGDEAIIESLLDPLFAIQLIELGCIPGERLLLKIMAPLRDPIAIEVAGNLVSLRRAEAKTIEVRKI